MYKKRKSAFLLVIFLLSVFIPSVEVSAKVQNFENLYTELTLPEDTIVVPADASTLDERWTQIGIMNPKEEKKILEQMGVQAILYDPATKASVRLIQKRSTKSAEIFNLAQVSETEREEFLNSLFTAPDENTSFEIDTYDHPELPFFRLKLEVKTESTRALEVIYGTVVNGTVISYDLYQENSNKALDETYIKALVAGTHFTKFLDKAEVKRQERQAMLTIGIVIAAFAAFIVVWVIISSRKKKRLAAARKEKSARLAEFYREQKQREEQNIKDPVIYTNHSVYNEELIKNFCIYDAIFHRIKLWITTVIIYILLLALLNNSNQSALGFIVVTIIGFFFLLYQGIQIDKTTKKMMKPYEHSKSKEAIIQFYEDYFTLSGIQSAVKNPYMQIAEYREYKNYIYLYLGSDRAIYLDKNGFDQDASEVKQFILNKIK